MQDWLNHFLMSFANQAGSWFLGVVLTLLGALSGRVVEKVKFSLNRADLRIKHYEKMAVEISRFTFIIDRLVNVYFGSNWVDEEGKGAIAHEYDKVTNKVRRMEYVYRSWIRRYWPREKYDIFLFTMKTMQNIDAVLRSLNEQPNDPTLLPQLRSEFRTLQRSVDALLAPDESFWSKLGIHGHRHRPACRRRRSSKTLIKNC
jgi:hypothetical protein